MSYVSRTGVERLFDPIAQIELDAAVAGGRAWHGARARLIATFADWGAKRHQPMWARVRSSRFIYQVSGMFLETACKGERLKEIPRPFGWRWERCLGRDLYLLMPWWIYYPRRAWQQRWTIYRALVTAGFWSIKEGGYYSEGHWTWAWWRTLAAQWTNTPERFSYRVLGMKRVRPPSRWERFGWWIQRRIIDDWKTRMPGWG